MSHILINGRFEDHFPQVGYGTEILIVTDAPVDLTQYQWNLLCDHDYPMIIFAGLKGADSLRKKILAIDRACGRELTQWIQYQSANLVSLLYSVDGEKHVRSSPELAYELNDMDYVPDGNHPYSLSVAEVATAISQASYHIDLRDRTIIDPFAGIGTTMIAAELHGLPSIGIEMDKGYYCIAKNRVKTLHNE